MRTKKHLSLVAAVGALASLAACGSSGSSTTASSGSATSGGAASAAPIATAPANGNSTDWVAWDKASCSFKAAATHPEKYEAVMRKQASPLTVGFGAQDTVNEVNISMNKSMQDSATKAGVDLQIADYKFPSTTDPVTAAKGLVVRSPAVVVSNNQLDDLLKSVNAIYTAACIPVVQVVTQAPGTVLFGPSNAGMGELEGKRLVEVAQKRGWTATDTTLITTFYSPAGPEVAKRASVCADVVKKALPGIKSVESDTKSTTSLELQNNFTDVLSANPDAKHILNCTVADLWALANANALKVAGRQADAAVTGVNGGTAVLDAIKQGSTALVGTVDLGAAKWGDYWIPMAQDIAAGKPVPSEVYAPIEMLPAEVS